MTNEEAIELLKNMHWSITTKMNREVPSSLALNMAIAALKGKDTNVLTNSALDHIHNVVRDDAYKRGYEQGKKDAKVEAIPVDWLENFLREESNKGLKSDALLVAYGIIILCKWKGETDGKID